MVQLLRHRQTKESATDRLHLNHRVTPRLHSATCKAAENDCLERRNSIRPRVSSRVAYKAERRGNELFWSPWKCTHARKSGTETARPRCICQHEVERALGLVEWSDYTNARKR